jgi:NAD(P)-dependent dehydrogenase (short-subunit alcohol dehydrogenase family)
MDGRFEGKVAVVSGSTHDPSIGRAIARRLGREGASVVINGPEADVLADAERALRAEGLTVASCCGRLGEPGAAAALVDTAISAFGRLDLVVNTVGGAPYAGPPFETTRDDLVGTLELNTWPALELLEEALRAGLGDGGVVLFVSSASVNKTTPRMAAYAASKAALNALIRTLARELARRGIRLNGVAPALTRTTATRDLWEADGGVAVGRNAVLGRLTEADDVAGAAAFLLSDDARAVTGVVINVDGGNHLDSGGWSPNA